MLYALLKAGHIIAVVIWFGGMMAAALMLWRSRAGAAPLRTWDGLVTTPAMVASWVLGLSMATWGGWFASGWLIVKLIFVLALSGIHGLLSGQLRRVAADSGAVSKPDARLMLAAMIAILCAIVLLVVVKPF